MKRFFIGSVILIFIISASGALLLPSRYVVPILMYHNIEEKEKLDLLTVPPKDFQIEMKFLRDNRYNVIYLRELVTLIINNKRIPKKTVVITFDDGPENNWTNAYPILKRYKIPATMFVIPAHCGKNGYLNASQLREMAHDGIDIGSHTLNDVWLPGCDEKRLNEELTGSRAALEMITGRQVDFISYPLGGFNQRVRLAVMKAGFKAACATNPGRYTANNDIYALKRLKVSGKSSSNLLAFWFKASGYQTWWKERKRPKKPKR